MQVRSLQVQQKLEYYSALSYKLNQPDKWAILALGLFNISNALSKVGHT